MRRYVPKTAISKAVPSSGGAAWKKRAIGAVKHSLLVTVYFMLRDNNPTRILALTTLINSILNNVFVTMSADSKNSDKKWSFHLWLMQRKPHPQPDFQGGTMFTKQEKVMLKSGRFANPVVRISCPSCASW